MFRISVSSFAVIPGPQEPAVRFVCLNQLKAWCQFPSSRLCVAASPKCRGPSERLWLWEGRARRCLGGTAGGEQGLLNRGQRGSPGSSRAAGPASPRSAGRKIGFGKMVTVALNTLVNFPELNKFPACTEEIWRALRSSIQRDAAGTLDLRSGLTTSSSLRENRSPFWSCWSSAWRGQRRWECVIEEQGGVAEG